LRFQANLGAILGAIFGRASRRDLCGFQNRKGLQIDSTKKAIFFYVYALLHHPLYRERYQENLKRELPRLPLVGDRQTFLTLVDIGQKLADLHLNYETVEEYPLEWVENKKVPWTWRVEKMKLTKEKDAIIVNRCLTLKGIPASAFEYQLGNRSALEWVIDQYQITTDKRSGITNDPNRGDEPQYIVQLVGKVLTVSVETVKLVARLREVRM
jgi:predicted helicase